MDNISQAAYCRTGAVTVMRAGALGDFVLTLPAIQALRDAHAQLHFAIDREVVVRA